MSVDATYLTKTPHTRRVLITGATGAIGGALAKAYATPQTHLILHGRNVSALEDVANACREKGLTCRSPPSTSLMREALAQWLTTLRAEQLPDIVIANAGKNTHPEQLGELEPWADVQALLNINLTTPLPWRSTWYPPCAHGVAANWYSLAHWQVGMDYPARPRTVPAKRASKRMAKPCAACSPCGIGVTVVMPGYVTSPMCNAMPGPKPFEWPPERAAKVIIRGIRANRARVSFPFPLNFGTWWLAVLPAGVSQWLIKRLGFDHVGGR
ncbi:oxidoreductase [Vreelandella aquamarina]|nr:oxidoreductase [Halomonas axialensis]